MGINCYNIYQYVMCFYQLFVNFPFYLYKREGASSSWSYGRWIYNYLCNQCLSPLTVVNLNPVHGEVYPIQHYVTCDRLMVFSGYSGLFCR